MNEDLKNFIKDYKKTNWDALLRENMGDYHLKELKPHLEFIKKFFDDLLDHPYFGLSYQKYERTLSRYLYEFYRIKTEIEQYKDGALKQQVIGQVVAYKHKVIENLKPVFDILQIQMKYHSDENTSDPEGIVKRYSRATREVEQELKKLNRMRSELSEQTVRQEASRYGDFFKKEAEDNKRKSCWFGASLLALSVGACLLAYKFLKFDHNIEVDSIFDLIIKGDVINKVFIFSIIFLIISVIKREYLALRHQMTVNKHRHNALSSHKEILNSIHKTANESDKEISNAVLLELTKSMFSPQETGYVKDQKGSSSSSVVEVSKSMFKNSNN